MTYLHNTSSTSSLWIILILSFTLLVSRTSAELYSDANLQVKKGLHFYKLTVPASRSIDVPDISSVSFLDISDDIIFTEMELYFDGYPNDGQLLILKNRNSKAVIKSPMGIIIPPRTTTLFLYTDMDEWTIINDIRNKSISSLQANDADNESMTKQRNTKNKGGKDMRVQSLDAKVFSGSKLDFQGGTIANVVIANATIDGLDHLKVKTIEISSEVSTRRSTGSRIVTAGPRGELSSIEHMKWDEEAQSLRVPALTSTFGPSFQVHADVDFTSHTLRNFTLDPNTTLKDILIEGAVIKDATLKNVVSEDLKFKAIEVDTIAVNSFRRYDDRGLYVSVGESGMLEAQQGMRKQSGIIEFTDKVSFMNSIDFNGNAMSNVVITSGHLSGDDIQINAKDVSSESLSLLSIKYSKNFMKDTLLVADEDGKVKGSSISIDDGWMGDLKIAGEIRFRLEGNHEIDSDDVKQGRIRDAEIVGGSIEALERLSVIGKSDLRGDLHVHDTANFHDGISVNGPVLGTGPYIDVSDRRLKENIVPLSDEDPQILHKLLELQAVSYDLDPYKVAELTDSEPILHEDRDVKHIGYIAQDVEQIFKEYDLVESIGNDDILGVKYARFIPILSEAMKDLNTQIQQLKDENKSLRGIVGRLEEHLERL